jgi:TPR repeat protein
MAASSSTHLSLRPAFILLLAVACGRSSLAQDSVDDGGFDLERATRAPPADIAALEARAFGALNGLFGRMSPSSAVPELIEAAERGSAAAMAQLGSMYQSGTGVTRDVATATRYMAAAAERGNVVGQVYMGGLYLYGAGVDADIERARAWFEAAANQQDPYALYLLSDMYATGVGVQADKALGFELLSRSAALGHMDAQRRLGFWLLEEGDQRDPARAIAMLERTATVDPHTAFLLGYQYLLGSLVTRDVALASQWLATAADEGNAQAQLLLLDLSEQGFEIQHNSRRSRAEILATASPEDQNGFAWRYSVSPDDTLRNGSLAVEIMEDLLDSADMVNAARLDTLAAAYAEVGRFEEAVATEEAAIDRLRNERGPQSPPVEAVEAMLPQYRERLDSYRAGQPYRNPF